MSKILSISETLSLLEKLRETVRDFAAREEGLVRESRNVAEAAEARYRKEINADRTQAEAERRDAEMLQSKELERAQSRFAQRETLLAEAHAHSRKKRLSQVDDEEGRRKYRVQKGMLDTERFQEKALAENDAALTAGQQRLAANADRFGALEREAHSAFRGYPSLRKTMRSEPPLPPEEHARSHNESLDSLDRLAGDTEGMLGKFKKLPLPALFRFVPIWLWAALFVAAVPVLRFSIPQPLSWLQSAAAAAAGLVLMGLLYAIGMKQARVLGAKISSSISMSRTMQLAAGQKLQAWHAGEAERIKIETRERVQSFEKEWEDAIQEANTARQHWPSQLEAKWRLIRERHDRRYRAKLSKIESEQAARRNELELRVRNRNREVVDRGEKLLAELRQKHDRAWHELASAWKEQISPIYRVIGEANAAADAAFPSWDSQAFREWRPPNSFEPAARFGRLELQPGKFAGVLPQDPRLALPTPEPVTMPLVLLPPAESSCLIEAAGEAKQAAVASTNAAIFRLLASSPPGKLSITIYDPIGLGQNFAALTHLGDYEDGPIDGRIWTQPDQLEQRLSELNDHMEKVIQMYLRNEYATLADYNQIAGNIAEKYHYLVMADFPAGLSETAARRLIRIAASGARCGVYTLIHLDPRPAAAPDQLLEELRKSSVTVRYSGNSFALLHPSASPAKVVLDTPPPVDVGNEFITRLGESSRDANRVQVPFAQVAPDESDIWSLDTSTELRVPIGRSGANKLQYLALGSGTRQHALIAGKTGSGKSTLFHVIITNLALWASPEQVEFYLIDFKKGVEFKSYAAGRLPHARVVAIESDREFGLSVLQRLDEELRRRGELFRRAGVQDLASYKRTPGSEPMPRSLLMIDEFQEFFVEEDRISQSANMLLDRIVRQGRAFGIHVILGSQTLGGAYTLARTTMGQMVVRIALQSNEADAYLIMDENNSAPRLLSRPGEGIYNDMAGAVEGNSPFQAVWLSESEREAALKKVRARVESARKKYPEPVVFEGNAPADVRSNDLLEGLLLMAPAEAPANARAWLGAPNSIKGPTEAVFRIRAGSNLLIVGQREESIATMISVSLLALSRQFPEGAARFVLLHSTAPNSAERALLERISRLAGPHLLLANDDLSGAIGGLHEELVRRTEGNPNQPRIFLFIHGMQNFKKLRPEDEFSFSSSETGPNPAGQLTRIISEGPSHGMHVIATFDTYNNVNRFLGRKALSEFEMRVLFQMSPSDSANLSDEPKASSLGLHRALLYNEQEGTLETFRPYALPDPAWPGNAEARGVR